MRVPTAVVDRPRLPLTIVGGESEAGKTTLLGRLVSQEHGGGLAVVLDKLDGLGIDPTLVAQLDGPCMTLTNRAMCCAASGDLSEELAELRPRLPASAHVLIEANADASLRRLAGYGYMPGYRGDGVIMVMDVRTVHRALADTTLQRRLVTQLHGVDILVINKLDLADFGARSSRRAWLDSALPKLRVVETSHGRVAVSLLLGMSPEMARTDARAVPGSWETTTYRRSARERSLRRSECVEPPCRIWRIDTHEPIAAQHFRTWISLLPQSVMRADGDVLFAEDPLLRYRLHMIGHRWQVKREQPWGAELPATRLTLVGM